MIHPLLLIRLNREEHGSQEDMEHSNKGPVVPTEYVQYYMAILTKANRILRSR